MNTIYFSDEQKKHIEHIIDGWFNEWRLSITDYEGTHRLGYAKEKLKDLICPVRPMLLFNEDEVDYICEKIGDWYFEWKTRLVDYDKRTNHLQEAINSLKSELLR
jgi:hypothetical protein